MKFNNPKLIFVFLLLISTLIRLDSVRQKQHINYDEGISYLAATCHQGAYEEETFPLMPATANTWKQYIQSPDHLCFSQISQDLAKTDIHPPIYFWLLHIWVYFFPVTASSGPLLNIFIATATTLILFQFASEVLPKQEEALLVILSYAFNLSVLLLSLEARQYDLLAFWAILCIWQTWRYVHVPEKFSSGHLFVFALITLGGMLTHFHFLLVVSACWLYMVFYYRQQWRPLIPVTIAFGSGVFVSFLVFPFVSVMFQREVSRTEPTNWVNFLGRAEAVLLSPLTFYYVIIPCLFVALFLFGQRWLSAQKKIGRVQGINLLFFPVWIGVGIFTLYLAFLSPKHAMGPPKYLSMVWLFLAFLPAFLLQAFRGRRTIWLYLVLIPFIYAMMTPILARRVKAQLTVPPSIQTADLIIIDTQARGVVTQLLWLMPNTPYVLIADQERLLEDSSWQNDLATQTVYISVLDEGTNSLTQQETLIDIIAGNGYDVVPESLATNTSRFTVFNFTKVVP